MSYDASTIRQLNALTSDFYAREAASFSATRQAPWHGWGKARDTIMAYDPAFARRATDPAGTPLAVLDLGCGNLRFERFLAERTSAPLCVCAFDNCPELASVEVGTPATIARMGDAAGQNAHLPEQVAVEFQTLDLVESFLNGTFESCLPRAQCDLAVAFGLMHHLPSAALRTQLLEGLLGSLKPGGFAILSFWQFLNDPRLAAKAAAATAEGRAAHHLPAFQENDFLLVWQHAEDIYRFCHHTPDAEIDALLAAICDPRPASIGGHASTASLPCPAPSPFREIARFSADGKQGNLNRYLVLQHL